MASSYLLPSSPAPTTLLVVPSSTFGANDPMNPVVNAIVAGTGVFTNLTGSIGSITSLVSTTSASSNSTITSIVNTNYTGIAFNVLSLVDSGITGTNTNIASLVDTSFTGTTATITNLTGTTATITSVNGVLFNTVGNSTVTSLITTNFTGTNMTLSTALTIPNGPIISNYVPAVQVTTITNAQLLLLHTTPINITPVPPTGYTTMPMGATIELVYGGVAFTGTTALYIMNAGSLSLGLGGPTTNAFLQATSNSTMFLPLTTNSGLSSTLANQPLVVYNFGTQATAGNGTLIVTCNYAFVAL